MIAIFSGFLAGVIHVFIGLDHLLAISTLTIDKKKSPIKIGLNWGVGHSISVLLLGIIFLVFKEIAKLEMISFYSEKFAGIILALTGIWGIKKTIFSKFHNHEHEHKNLKHSHFHFKNENHIHTHASFGIGVIHGLAGTSHILGVLPALVFNSNFDAIFYLIFFGLGTILSMGIFSNLIGKISKQIFYKSKIVHRKILLGFSFASILTGIFWFYNS